MLDSIQFGMEMEQLEQEKKICEEIQRNILMVIDGGIFAEHERILRDAVVKFTDDFPEHR